MLKVSIPMVLQKLPGSGLEIPTPVKVPSIPGYGFRGGAGRKRKDGNWEWLLDYEGTGPMSAGENKQPGENDELTVYTLEPSDAEVPISSHPDILKFLKEFEGRLEDNKIIFGAKLRKNASVEEYLEQQKNPFFGVEAYLSCGATWTKSYAATSLPASLFSKVGCIVADVPQPRWLKLPRLEKGVNWLKRRPTLRIRGKTVEITERYLASGRGGHNKWIYREGVS